MMGHGDKLLRFAEELDVNPEKILDFSSNINPFPPESVMEFLHENLNLLKFYPESSYTDVRSVISETFDIPVNQIMLGNGSIELIKYFFLVIRPERTLIPYPTFTEFERYAESINSRILHVHERDIISGEFISHLGEVDACVICNPNNPTGRTIPKKIIEETVGEAEKRNCMLLVDMAYADFVDDAEDLPVSENTFVTRTLTKILGIPGLRAGYGFAPVRISEKIERIRDPWNLNSLAYGILKNFIPELHEIKEGICRKLRDLRRDLIARLNTINGLKTFESETHYFLVKHAEMKKVDEELRNKKILIRLCDDFRGLDNRYARISVRKEGDNRRLFNELKSLIP